MRKTAFFVSTMAALVAAFSLIGCGQGNPGPDGDLPMDDGGMPPDSDSGMDPPDGGTDPEDGGGGNVCTPSLEAPLCAGASECECDDFRGCEGSADPVCLDGSDGNRINECEAGVFNRCGFDLPLAMEGMDMSTYRGEEFTCAAQLMGLHTFDVAGQPGTCTMELTVINGQYILNSTCFGSEGYWTCGNGNRCWFNWSHSDSQYHAEMDFRYSEWLSMDCAEATARFYMPDAGIGEHYDSQDYARQD